MKRSVYSTLLVASALVGVVLSFQNCSQAEFSTGDATNSTTSTQFGNLNGDALAQLIQNGEQIQDVAVGTTGGGNTRCHRFDLVTQPLKVLVMVDNSGSADQTDPGKQFRLGLLNAFLTNYQGKTNFSWNLDYFAGSQAYALINSGSQSNPIFSNASAMSSALATYSMIPNGGNTPYAAALAMMKLAIQQDVDFSNPSMNYALAFISDGMPNPNITDADLARDVQDIVKTKPGRVSLSTVYFGRADAYQQDAPAALARLQAMALIGGGQFANTIVEGSNLNFADVLTVPSAICP